MFKGHSVHVAYGTSVDENVVYMADLLAYKCMFMVTALLITMIMMIMTITLMMVMRRKRDLVQVQFCPRCIWYFGCDWQTKG